MQKACGGTSAFSTLPYYKLLRSSGFERLTDRFSLPSLLQVAIKAGLFSLPFSLEVFTPRAAIVGGSEFHLDRGSTISLRCVVRQATQQTQ